MGAGIAVVIADGFGCMGCVLLFADGEELAEGGQGGDGYSDVLFETARMD